MFKRLIYFFFLLSIVPPFYSCAGARLSSHFVSSENPFGKSDSLEHHAVKRELRGVWIATAFGIDWPKTTNSALQRASLDSLFREIKRKKFNAVFFQVRVRADVLYPNRFEPIHEYLTGTFGKEPDYDPVAFAIDCAKRHGLQFHAWFNTLIVRGKNFSKVSQGVPYIWQTHPEWIDPRASKNPDWRDVWLNPTLPEVQAYLKTLIADFAHRYSPDGIQLDDYLRYPSKDFPDSLAFATQNPAKLPLPDFRRDIINRIVAEIADTLVKIKPHLQFGVTPIGVYRRVDSEPAMESKTEVYQDSREWTKRRYCDYLAPQIYFHLGPTTKAEREKKQFNPAFEKLVNDWAENKNYRHLYVGLGTYKPAVKAEWRAQVNVVRNSGAEGFIFYPYSSIAELDSLFDSEALPPSMPWKSDTIPPTPIVISIMKQDSLVVVSLQISNAEEAKIRGVNLYHITPVGLDSGEMNRDDAQRPRERLLLSLLPLQNGMIRVRGLQSGESLRIRVMDWYGNESKGSEILVVP